MSGRPVGRRGGHCAWSVAPPGWDRRWRPAGQWGPACTWGSGPRAVVRGALGLGWWGGRTDQGIVVSGDATGADSVPAQVSAVERNADYEQMSRVVLWLPRRL